MRISDWSSNVCSSDLAYLALVSSGVSAQRQVWMHGDTPPEALAAMKEATACVVEREEFYQQGKEILAGYEPIVGEPLARNARSEEHTSELQSLMRISYAVFCLKKKTTDKLQQTPCKKM